MRKFQYSLFVLKRSYICYYIICMTVPLNHKSSISVSQQEKNPLPTLVDLFIFNDDNKKHECVFFNTQD